MRMCVEKEEFWAIGDVERRLFLGSKGNGPYYGDTLIDVGMEDCWQYGSYDEARAAMKDDDVKYWRTTMGHAERIRPVRIIQTFTAVIHNKRKTRKVQKHV